MGIELNATLNAFVNWASQDNIGKTSLVHATATPATVRSRAHRLSTRSIPPGRI